MRCLTEKQLNMLIGGGVDSAERLQWMLHLEECSQCRSRLRECRQFAFAAGKLAERILQVEDCPEYEKLSAYLDGELTDRESKIITAHVNSCEYCYRDIQTMQSLRAQAALRDTITVSPDVAGQPRGVRSGWKWVFGASAGAVAVGLIVAALPLLHRTTPNVPVADVPKPPSLVIKHTPTGQPLKGEKAPQKRVVASVPKGDKAIISVKKQPEVVLRDGAVRIIKKNGKLELLVEGKGGSVEKLIASYVEQKLHNGKVEPSESVMLAQSSIAVRGGSNKAQSMSVAPKPYYPVNKVIVSAQPLLEWSKVDLAQDYKVTITDPEGRVVYESVTDKNRIKIGIALERGKVYQWRVASRFSDESSWEASGAAAFKVISNEDLKLIEDTKKSFGGSKLALGAVYESLQLQDEADREYRSLSGRVKNAEILRSLNGK